MSGILGLYNLDGRPVREGELLDMAAMLATRGPDRTGVWHDVAVGLGHTLLATTPEMLLEDLPLEHPGSGCVITGDIRLDNRDELLAVLGLADRRAVLGDAGIVLEAYLRWGETCPVRLLGDFAFAVWDPRRRTLFCARDKLGMRQLTYHHTRGTLFGFATEPRALLVHPRVPYELNEARIADFLLLELEGIDKTSTFFAGVYRLPPAHTLTVDGRGAVVRRYWTLEPGPELRLASDAEYVEAFREVFDRAVADRVRAVGPVGSMLSGGIDSSTAAAIASLLLTAEGRGPLRTFSAVSTDGDSDLETDAVNVAVTMVGLEPTIVSAEALDRALPRLLERMNCVEEPFDVHMAMIQALYLASKDAGVTVLMDGGAGDVMLWRGEYLARMLRAGRVRSAFREARARSRFWQGEVHAGRELLRSAMVAYVPHPILAPVAMRRCSTRNERRVRASLIAPEFGRAVSARERLDALARLDDVRVFLDAPRDRAAGIEHPYIVVGRERYDRVAGANGVEPRDPYFDVRVANLCMQLPDEQVSAGGWPKLVLRRAAVGGLPDAVRLRRDVQQPGWAFTHAVWRRLAPAVWDDIVTGDGGGIGRYVELGRTRELIQNARNGEVDVLEKAYDLAGLAVWLRQHARRPAPSRRR